MNGYEMCYYINKAAVNFEIRTETRPEVIVTSKELYNDLIKVFLVTAHMIKDAENIIAAPYIMGMRLEVNPSKHGKKIILGNEYDLEEIASKGR